MPATHRSGRTPPHSTSDCVRLSKPAAALRPREMQFKTLDGEKTAIGEADFERLRTAFRGRLIALSEADYDKARRVWNGTIDRRPALIAQCSGTADVIAAVTFASRHGLLVAVRGGGHSIPGHSVCDDGLVI